MSDSLFAHHYDGPRVDPTPTVVHPNLSCAGLNTDTNALLSQVRRYVLLVDDARQSGNDAVLWSAAGRLANAAADLDQAIVHGSLVPDDWNHGRRTTGG